MGIWRELSVKNIAACNGKPPRSTKAFVQTVKEIDHHDVVSSCIVAVMFRDMRPQQWTKKDLNTFEEATEAYVVEVIVDSHFQKLRLISCRFSTCLLLWQGKEVGYS